jgi:hypothetical protein
MTNKAQQLLNKAYNTSVSSADSTSELIRKHKLFHDLDEAISNDELQRGRDFGGTEEDSFANDLTECEELLYERAVLRHDTEAGNYIMDNGVNGLWWITQQLNQAKEALEQLRAGNKEAAEQILQSISPDDYSSAGTEDEEEK